VKHPALIQRVHSVFIGQVQERRGMKEAMPRSTNRNLSRRDDPAVVKEGLVSGRRIVVGATAGPRLGGKKGFVLGPGATANQVRVLLDGSKGPITLHVRYVDLLKGPPA